MQTITKRLCPHCGSILRKKKKGATRDEYPLICDKCDENFFYIECEILKQDNYEREY